MAHEVFLSYSSRDKEIADVVCETLEHHKLMCWLAPRDIMPGQDWSEAIIDALDEAKVFVLLLSETSNTSEQVKREIQNAVQNDLVIVPFRIDDVVLTKHMRYFIGTPHWLDAFTAPFEPHLQRLVQVVSSVMHTRRGDSDSADEILTANIQQAPIAPRAAFVPSGKSASPQSPMGGCDEAGIKAVQRELATFLGPIAGTLVQREASKAKDMEALCQQMTSYLASPAEKTRFLETTRSLRTPKAAEAGAAGSAVQWNPETLRIVERQFAEYIGPLAGVLLKRTLPRAGNLDELYQLLGENLSTDADRKKFLSKRPAA